MNNNNEVVEMIPRSFSRDMVLVCSIGLNIGFAIGLLFL
jgi:hypothetical protein